MNSLTTEPETVLDNKPFKYIYKDNDTGKILVTENNNHKYRSDIYGRKLKYFLPDISGMLSGLNRSKLKMNISKSLNNISQNNNNDINIKNSRKKNIYINYIPGIKKIDGYNFLSKPISTPFYNEPNSLFSKKIKEQLNENINIFYDKENSKLQKNNNFRISYLNKSLNNNLLEKKDEEKIITLINKSIDELKQENKLKLSAIEKNPNYLALNRFKKKIYDDNNKGIYSKLKETPLEIQEKNNILKNVIQYKIKEIKKQTELFEKRKKKIMNKYLYQKSNSSFDIQKNKFNNIKINTNTNNNIIIGPDKVNDIFRSKDFSLGRNIKMDFGAFSYSKDNMKEKSKDNIEEKELNNNTNTTENKKIDKILPKIKIKKLDKVNDLLTNKNILNQETETAETNTRFNRNNSDNHFIYNNKSLDEISFISHENDKNDKGDIKNKNYKNNIHSLKTVKSHAEIEKELLKGIKLEKPKELNEEKKIKIKPVLKTEGQLYIQNLELLKKSNKRQYDLQKKKDEYDLMLLKKKLGNKRNIKIIINGNNE